MDVYPTRRSCGFPDFVYERTKTNAREAKLAANGWGLEKGIGAAVLFPIPKTGAEAVWNHKVRYMGEGRIEYYATIFSNKGGDFTPLAQDQWTWVPFHTPKNKGVDEVAGVEMKLLNAVVSPAARVGELILAHWFFNEASDAWLYFPGQRRTRRAPSFNYDNPVPGYENLETVDAVPDVRRRDGPLRLEARRQAGALHPVQQLQARSTRAASTRTSISATSSTATSSATSCIGVEGRGDRQAGHAPPDRETRLLSRRGQLGA